MFIAVTIVLFSLIRGDVALVCLKSSPANCVHNSTCEYRSIECRRSDSMNLRGGMYCSTLVRLVNKEILIGNMDCMYDQETTKSCKNQSTCLLKSTRKDLSYLHCCCDQHQCNLNFQITNHSNNDPSIPWNNSSALRHCWFGVCFSKWSLVILSVVCFFIVALFVALCFVFRHRSIVSRVKLCQVFHKSHRSEKKKTSTTDEKRNDEDEDLLAKSEKSICMNEVQMGPRLKGGRFANIFRATYRDIPCAMKVFSTSSPSTVNEAKKLFTNEKQIYSAQMMDHVNLLKFYGCVLDECSYSLLLELSPNGSLRDVLRSRMLKDEKELQFLCEQISSGLEYLHRDFRFQNSRPPIAHRDFKSDNILYFNEQRVVLCDFAMSILLDQQQNCPHEQQQIGTARYMSPELLSGTIGYEANALLKCDVYALGIVFWEILSRYRCDEHVESEEYEMPFQQQLQREHFNLTPSIAEMSTIIHSVSPFNRPLIRPCWKEHRLTRVICSTMEECWDSNPEGRINVALVALRMQKSI